MEMGHFYPTVSQNLLPYGCELGCFQSPRVDSQRFKVRTGNPLASLPHATPQPRIAVHDSQHPLDGEHFCSDQARGDFSVPSVDDEIPGTGVAAPGEANRSGSLISKLAGCVTTSDLTPLSSLLSRHRRGSATYGVTRCRSEDRDAWDLDCPLEVGGNGGQTRLETSSRPDPTPTLDVVRVSLSHIRCRSKSTVCGPQISPADH
jgi:hypothetical protein